MAKKTYYKYNKETGELDFYFGEDFQETPSESIPLQVAQKYYKNKNLRDFDYQSRDTSGISNQRQADNSYYGGIQRYRANNLSSGGYSNGRTSSYRDRDTSSASTTSRKQQERQNQTKLSEFADWAKKIRQSENINTREAARQSEDYKSYLEKNKGSIDTATLAQARRLLALADNEIANRAQKGLDERRSGTQVAQSKGYKGVNEYTSESDLIKNVQKQSAAIEQEKERKRQEEQAAYDAKTNEYMRMSLDRDFDRQSNYRQTKRNELWANENERKSAQAYNDPLYEYVNQNPEAQKTIDEYGDGSFLRSTVGVDNTFLKQMNDDEIRTFNYIDKTKGRDAATEYLEHIKPQLTERQREVNTARAERLAQENPVIGSIATVAASPFNAAASFGQFADIVKDGTIDQNARYNQMSYMPTAIRNKVSENFGPVGSFLYQTGMSMADFLYSSALLGGSEPLMLGVMSSSAAAQKVIEAKDNGLDDASAFALGAVAGAAEFVTEKISVEALLDDIPRLGKDFAGYFFKNFFAEGSEEVGSDMINLIADVAISKDKSDWNKSIQEYMRKGYSEQQAFGLAMADQAKQMGLSFLGGALSGAGMAAGVGGINIANAVGEQLREDTTNYDTNLAKGTTASQSEAAQEFLKKVATDMQMAKDNDTDSAWKTNTENYTGTKEDVAPTEVVEDAVVEESEPNPTVTLEQVAREQAAEQTQAEADRYAEFDSKVDANENLGETGKAAFKQLAREIDNAIDNGSVAAEQADEVREYLNSSFNEAYTAGRTGLDRTAVKTNAGMFSEMGYQAGLEDGRLASAREIANAKEHVAPTVSLNEGTKLAAYGNTEAGIANTKEELQDFKEYIDPTTGAPRLTNEIINKWNTVGKLLGMRVRFTDTLKENAYIDKNGEIVVAMDAGVGKTMDFYLSHEFTHRLQQASPATYNALVASVRATYGDTFATAVSEYQAKAKARGIELSEADAIDEVVADHIGNLLEADSTALDDFIRQHVGTREGRTLIQKVRDFMRSIARKLSGTEMSRKYSEVEKRLSEALQASYEEVQRTLNERQNESNTEQLEKLGVDSVADGDMIVRNSYRTWTETDKAKLKKKLLQADLGYTEEEIDKWINDVNGIAAIIASDPNRLDYEASPVHKFLKANGDYYKKTLDASTLCAKRLLYQGTYNAIMHELKNEPLTVGDVIQLRMMMKDMGYEVPCGICYVESQRKMLGQYASEWLEKYDGKYIPTLDEVTTTDGLEQLRNEHPETYDAFLKAMKGKGVQSPKVVELRTEYRQDLVKMTQSTVDYLNKIGGLRINSFSDFETVHTIDFMQAVMDMSSKGLKGMAYTKVPAFAKIFGPTGIKINLSLIPKVDANGNIMRDKNGKPMFDSVEGMDIKDALAIRDMYPDNVATIVVAKDMAHCLEMLDDDRIDYVIPFHRSKWTQAEFEKLGLRGYEDFATGHQSSEVFPSEYWDGEKSGKENAERYLEICKERGVTPVFEQLLEKNKDGSYSLKKDGSTDNYWKLLIEGKMYNHLTGEAAPQQVVRPDFNMEAAKETMDAYDGNPNTLPVADKAVKEFVKYKKEQQHAGKRHSLRQDSSGRELTEGQKEFFKDSKIVDENGNLKVMYHGTGRADRVGTVFRGDRATSGPMAYFTDNKAIATNYSKDKADTSLAYEDEDINDYYNQFVVDVDGEEVNLLNYWGMLSASEKNRIKKVAGQIAYDYDNDDYDTFVIDENRTTGNGGYGTDPYTVRQAKGNAFRMLEDAWLQSGDLFGEEEKFLDILNLLGIKNARYKDPNYRDEKVYEVYLNVTNPLVTSEIDEEFISDVKDWLDNTDLDVYKKESMSADMWDKNNIDPYDWYDRLENDYANNTTHAWTSVPDVITDFLKEQGYDGVVDKGGKFSDDEHQVVIPFYSEQIKNVTNETPTEDKDIRYSIRQEDLDNAWLESLHLSDIIADLMNSSTKEKATRRVDEVNKRLKKLGLQFNGTTTAAWTDERIDKYLGGGFYGSTNPNYAQAHIAYMTPQQFLNLTVGSNTATMDRIEREALNYGDVDFEKLGDSAPISLIIDKKRAGADVIGHEGRHRMMMLGKAGFKQVPVLIFDSADKYNKTTLNNYTLRPQRFNDTDLISKGRNVTLDEMIPFSQGNRELIKQKFGSGNQEASVRYSFKGSENILTHAEVTADTAKLNKEIEKLQRRVEELEGEFKSNKGYKANRNDADKTARNLIKEYGVNAYEAGIDVKQMSDDFARWANQLARDPQGSYTDVRAEATKLAYKLMWNSKELVDTGTMVDDAQKLLKDQNIFVDSRIMSDIADFKELKKEYKGRLNFTADKSKGRAVDDIYQELNTIYPWLFPEDIQNPSDQLEQIFSAADAMAYISFNPYSEYDADTVDMVTNEIMDKLLGILGVKNPDSYRDKMEKRLATVRRQRDERIAKIDQHYREQKARAKLRRETSEVRQKLVKEMQKLKKMKTTGANRALINEVFGNLDATSQKITGKGLRDLHEIRNFVNALKNTDNDFLIDQRTRDKLERLSAIEKQIKDAGMTLEEVLERNKGWDQFSTDVWEAYDSSLEVMTDMLNVLKALEAQIRNEMNTIDTEDRRDKFQQGLASIEAINNSYGNNSAFAEFFDKYLFTEAARPSTEMLRIVGYNEDAPLYQRFLNLTQGQRNMVDYGRRANERYFDKFINDKEFISEVTGKKAREIEINGIGQNGEPVTVKVTPDLLMSMYMHSLNDSNVRHIDPEYGGGMTVPDIKLYKDGKTAKAYEKGTLVKMGRSGLRNVALNNLTQKERAFILSAQKYYKEMSQPEINAVSEKLLGYSIANVENYYRIVTDKNWMKTNLDQMKFDGTIEGMGFTKERIQAKNPIQLIGMISQVTTDIKMHSKYVGLAIPVRNFNQVYGTSAKAFDKEGNVKSNYASAVMDSIQKKWGDKANQYIVNMMSDIQNPKRSTDTAYGPVFAKLRSNYASSTLVLNAGVGIKQAASYPTAAAELGWKPLAQALAMFPKTKGKDANFIAQYSPLMRLRQEGYISQETGDILTEGKKLPKAANWIQMVDIGTVRLLWLASEYSVRETNPELKYGTKEFYEKVGEVHTRVIENTQPNYTELQRAQILRSDKEIVRMLNMFKTQPLQNFNILMEAFGNNRAKSIAYKNNPTEENLAKLKLARKKLGRAISSQLVAAMVFTGMQMLWDLFRGKRKKYEDKEGELTAPAILKANGINMIANLGGMLPFGSTIVEGLEATSDKIAQAFGGDKVFDQKYYGLDAGMSVEAINSMVTDGSDFLASLVGVMQKVFNSAEAGSDIDWEGFGRDAKDIASDVCQAAGLPLNNVANLAGAMYGNSVKLTDGYFIGSYMQKRLESGITSYNKNEYFELLRQAYNTDTVQYTQLYDIMIHDDGFATSSKSSEEVIQDKMGDLIQRQDRLAHGITDEIWAEYDNRIAKDDKGNAKTSNMAVYEAVKDMNITDEQKQFLFSTKTHNYAKSIDDIAAEWEKNHAKEVARKEAGISDELYNKFKDAKKEIGGSSLSMDEFRQVVESMNLNGTQAEALWKEIFTKTADKGKTYADYLAEQNKPKSKSFGMAPLEDYRYSDRGQVHASNVKEGTFGRVWRRGDAGLNSNHPIGGRDYTADYEKIYAEEMDWILQRNPSYEFPKSVKEFKNELWEMGIDPDTIPNIYKFMTKARNTWDEYTDLVGTYKSKK